MGVSKESIAFMFLKGDAPCAVVVYGLACALSRRFQAARRSPGGLGRVGRV